MNLPNFLKNFSPPSNPYQLRAMKSFLERGLPTRALEHWHYTDMRRVLRNCTYEKCLPTREIPATPDRLESLNDNRTAFEDAIEIVIVNGHYVATDSNVKGVAVRTVIPTENIKYGIGGLVDTNISPMAALNAALQEQTTHITIDSFLASPLHISFINTKADTAVFPRVFIHVLAGARATLIESHENADVNHRFVHSVSEILIEDRAHLTHYKIEREASVVKNIFHTQVKVLASGHYARLSTFLGGGMSRDEVRIALDGTEANTTVKGLFLTRDKQFLDNTVFIAHNRPNCTSKQLFKGIVNHDSKTHFQGKILVDKVAQKTDGYQIHRAIMLSGNCEVCVKPELEIYADDVKCSHGSTAGQLDQQQVFYLLTRGIEKQMAKRLLLRAFCLEVLSDIEHASVKDHLMARVSRVIRENL